MGSRALCHSVWVEVALSAELCCHLVDQWPPRCRGGLVAGPWWLCQARARSPSERGTHRNCPFGCKGGNKAPLSQLLAGKGGILYKPIVNWQSKLTAVLFINSCNDEKCVFSWYFSKTGFCVGSPSCVSELIKLYGNIYSWE